MISKIVKIDNRKSKIYLNDECMGVLYQGEIRRLHLQEGSCISDEVLAKIHGILSHRAKERALYILGRMDKTEKEIRDKLKDGYFPKDIIDDVIKFLYKYNYIDDKRYAIQYVRCKESSKSIRQIREMLKKKGVSNEILEEVLSDAGGEQELISSLITKKIHGREISELDMKEKEKLFAYLMRKGFAYSEVREFF